MISAESIRACERRAWLRSLAILAGGLALAAIESADSGPDGAAVIAMLAIFGSACHLSGWSVYELELTAALRQECRER